jgi:hypothetical protein
MLVQAAYASADIAWPRRLTGYVFDPKNPEHVQAVQSGELELVKTHRQQVCVCVFTDNTLTFLRCQSLSSQQIPIYSHRGVSR